MQNCKKCSKDLLHTTENVCSVCAWDFWFSNQMSVSDLKKLVTLQQSTIEQQMKLDAELGNLYQIEQSLREKQQQIDLGIQEKKQELQKVNLAILPLSEEKKIIEIAVDGLKKETQTLIDELSFLKDDIIRCDSFTKQVVFTEINSRIIKIAFRNNIFYFETNFPEKPQIMMIINEYECDSSRFDNGSYYVNITTSIQQVQGLPNRWELSISRISLKLKGNFYVNFTNVFRDGFNERMHHMMQRSTKITL